MLPWQPLIIWMTKPPFCWLTRSTGHWIICRVASPFCSLHRDLRARSNPFAAFMNVNPLLIQSFAELPICRMNARIPLAANSFILKPTSMNGKRKCPAPSCAFTIITSKPSIAVRFPQGSRHQRILLHSAARPAASQPPQADCALSAFLSINHSPRILAMNFLNCHCEIALWAK